MQPSGMIGENFMKLKSDEQAIEDALELPLRTQATKARLRRFQADAKKQVACKKWVFFFKHRL